MQYRKVSLETTTEAVDFISCLFDELGMEGIQIEDKLPLSEADAKAMYIDILPELPEDDGVAVVSSYVPMDWDIEDLRIRIEDGLKQWEAVADLGSRRLSFAETDDKDWLNNWKEFFQPFRVTPRIVVKPTWRELENKNPGDLVIEIDPGTAFGTGAHESTALCMELMEKYVKPGAHVLDVGCGSGILSVLACRLSAGLVRATEIDEIAVGVTKENMAVNHLLPEADFQVYHGNLLADEDLKALLLQQKYDVVAANILADVIIPLAAEAGAYLTEDGVFLSSGIIEGKEAEVRQALLENGFEILEMRARKDWRSFVARKKR